MSTRAILVALKDERTISSTMVLLWRDIFSHNVSTGEDLGETTLKLKREQVCGLRESKITKMDQVAVQEAGYSLCRVYLYPPFFTAQTSATAFCMPVAWGHLKWTYEIGMVGVAG